VGDVHLGGVILLPKILAGDMIRQDFSNDLWLSFYLHVLINH
jgi:hypothetical protein